MDPDLDRIARCFREFATQARDLGSPLYERLALEIARDEEVLRLALGIRHPPHANILLGTVHYLLMGEPSHPLARFYGTLSEKAKPPEGAYPEFRAYLLARREEALPLLRTRITQTNEVRRCTYLLPAFAWIHEHGGGRPLAIVDVGCSAGLHLNWDRYRYDYGGAQAGDPSSPVVLRCEVRGPVGPPVPQRFPPCPFRAGIDRRPVDLADPVEKRWFFALLWPDRPERSKLAGAAAAELRAHPHRIVEGDVRAALPGLLGELPEATTPVVYHSHALYQGGAPDVDALREMLSGVSAPRAMEWLSCEGSEVVLRTVSGHEIEERHLAHKDPHGRWIEWLGGE